MSHPTPHAALGPPVPVDGMPDAPPFRLARVEEIAQPNHAGETMFFVDGEVATYRGTWETIKLILAGNPHSGVVTRAAMNSMTGGGYIAIDPTQLPGNLLDIVRTILLDPRPDA